MEQKDMQEMENIAEGSETMEAGTDNSTQQTISDDRQAEIEKLQQQIDELKDKYIRQVAEFDNLRKRTAKEKLEILQTAGKDVITSLLDVLDDSERAQKQIESAKDISALKEGLNLVFSKLKSTLQARGLKPMETVGTEFNPDIHEAISEIPAPTQEMKGKVIDELEKGYYLNDKIIRFAKVVVGK